MEKDWLAFTTRLPSRVIAMLRRDKMESGRKIEKILSDIIVEHYQQEKETK